MSKKIFNKNYINNDNHNRNEYGMIAGTLGIITNLILGIIKVIIGIISNSISIMADAINNITDTLTSILTIVGFKLSNKKPNKKHPYGYARFEYISGLAISMIMLFTGLFLIKESLIKIFIPTKITINLVTYLILLISIIIKIIQMYIYKFYYNIINSKTLQTNVIDSRNDIISTTAILISMIIMNIFNINIDGILGVGISLFIINSSIKMLNEVLEPIIGISPSSEQVNEIENKILSYDYVEGIHDLVIHNYGVHNDFVTVHVEIDSKIDILEAHDLMDVIENDFKENLGIELTIHMDPIVIGDKKVDKLKTKVIEALQKLDKDLTIHDFRIVEGKLYTNILFDCVIPYEKEYTLDNIKKALNENIKSKKHIYNYMIEIDRPFVNK